MAAIGGGTPSDYGLRVRTHPDGLIITAVNKMRSGTIMKLSYSGTISESVAFDVEQIKPNFERFSRFIEDIALHQQPTRTRDNLVWMRVDGAKVHALLTDVSTHPDSWKANSKLLAEYIQKKIDEEELTSWTVALISKTGNGREPVGGQQVALVTRVFKDPDGKKLSIGRLVNPVDETIDFDDEQRQEASNAR